jgi:hypothetical protein
VLLLWALRLLLLTSPAPWSRDVVLWWFAKRTKADAWADGLSETRRFHRRAILPTCAL